jgi:competence protein ComFC
VQCVICGRGERCDDCRRRTDTYFTANRSAVRYTESVKPWLARFKYRGDERLKLLFADMLEHAYKLNFHNRPGGISERIHILSYVPVSLERFEERGFNQAQLLAEELGKRLRIPVAPLLLRSKHTGKQSYKSRAERLEDMKQAFVIHPDAQKRILTKADFRPITILIIDDVYTTGSTLNQCAKVISLHLPAKVYSLTWAR